MEELPLLQIMNWNLYYLLFNILFSTIFHNNNNKNHPVWWPEIRKYTFTSKIKKKKFKKLKYKATDM